MKHSPYSSTNLVLLALTYFLYFGQLGVLVPYLGVFLDGRGFSSEQIGELFAIITLARIIGPYLWANYADRSGNALMVLRIGCFLTVSSFLSVLFVQGFWGLTLAFGVMMMFWTAVLPQLEVITMQSLSKGRVGYGQVRLWGSVGYIILTIAVGQALDWFGSDTPVYFALVTLLALWLSTLLLVQPTLPKSESKASGGLVTLVKNRPFVVFLVSAVMLQMSFGAYYGFFALYMRDIGHSGQITGLLLALGVVAEVLIFMLSRRLIKRYGVWWLLVVSMGLTALRWWALADYADLMPVLIATQLIHALSFGLTHAVSVHFIHHLFTPEFHSRAQAMYISVAFGFGGAIGNYAAGVLWQQGSGAQQTFYVAAGLALFGTLALFLLSKKQMD